MNFKKVLIGMSAVLVAVVLVGGVAYAKTDDSGKHGFSLANVYGMFNGTSKFKASGSESMKAPAGSKVEIAIGDNGKVRVGGAKITAINGATISAVSTWGSLSFNWTVMTNGSTQFLRLYGGASGLSEMAVGDFISFQGMLDTNASSPTVTATAVKDWSIQKTRATFNGTVQSANSADGSFVLTTENRGNITVKTTSTTKIAKGGIVGVFADIMVNAKVTASGLWNNLTNILEASEVKIKVPDTRTTLEGTVKTTAAGAVPTTFVMTSGGVDYTVKVAADTSILNVLWLHTALTNVHAGDKIRVYGLVNADHTIDATVVRDTAISL